MRPIVLPIVVLLVLPLALAQEPASADAPPWLAALLEARGVPPEDWAHVQVERRVLEEGAWRVEAATLADLVELPRATAAPGPAPDAVVGNLLHLMIQIGRCDGYEVEPLPGGVSKVGGSWDIGIHVVSAQSSPPGVDASDPQGSLTSAVTHEDLSVAAVGAVQLSETRINIFGTCLGLLGSMTGPGVFAFDQTWPA